MNKLSTDNVNSLFNFLLPKRLNGSEDGKKILAVLNSHLKPVKPEIDFIAPSFPISQSIMDALYSARRTGRLIRGFEDAEKKLSAERSGIASVDIKTVSKRMERISRLVIVANDGSERFYRQTGILVEKNKPRILVIHLDISSLELGERLYGPGKRALFLLINHKDAVINFLISIAK